MKFFIESKLTPPLHYYKRGPYSLKDHKRSIDIRNYKWGRCELGNTTIPVGSGDNEPDFILVVTFLKSGRQEFQIILLCQKRFKVGSQTFNNF